MSELKVYVKPIETNMFGKMIVGQSYYLKSEVDALLAEKDAEIVKLNDKALQYKVLDKEHCRDLNTQEKFFAEKICHHKYKRCLAMANWCSAELGMLVSTWESKIKHYKKWQRRWLELAEKFKEAK